MGALAAKFLTSLIPPLPFLLGAGSLAVLALILAAFAAREAFCPDAGRCPAWKATFVREPKTAAYGALAVAAVLGLALQFGWRTGDFTIPLGGLGILGGYFAFAPPLAWHRRGLGEAVGGICFGLLPVAAGLYLQCGHLLTEVLLYGLPLTFTGFNLFLIYGAPGPEGAPGFRTLAARVAPVTAALIFTLNNVLTITGLALILIFPAAALPWRFGLWPLLILAVIIQELVKRKAYQDERRIMLLAWLTLTLHLAMGLVFVVMLWQRL